MNILLIKTVLDVPYAAFTPPLGLLYIASYARKHVPDVSIKIHDLGLKKPLTPEFLLEFNPDIIGISSLTLELPEMIKTAEFCKNILPDVIIAAGGPCAFEFKKILDSQLIEAVFLGEGEFSFTEFLKKHKDKNLWRSIPGIAYYMNSDLIHTLPEIIEDLDSLEHPAFDLIELSYYSTVQTMSHYLKKGSYYAPIFTSRGCPFHCIYCHKIFGKTVRLRSADNVCDEIEYLVKNYGINEVHIFDDIFNIDENRLIKICSYIKKFDLKIAFPNGLRADVLNKRSIDSLCEAGTYSVCVAIESGSPKIQKILKKNLDLEKVRENIHYFNKRGIFTAGFVMIGFPFETITDIKMTSDYLAQTQLNLAYFFQVIPFPATELYEMCCEHNWIDTIDHEKAFFITELYNKENSVSPIHIDILNALIILMKLRFYNLFRVFRIFARARNKWWFVITLKRNIVYIIRTVFSFIIRR